MFSYYFSSFRNFVKEQLKQETNLRRDLQSELEKKSESFDLVNSRQKELQGRVSEMTKSLLNFHDQAWQISVRGFLPYWSIVGGCWLDGLPFRPFCGFRLGATVIYKQTGGSHNVWFTFYTNLIHPFLGICLLVSCIQTCHSSRFNRDIPIFQYKSRRIPISRFHVWKSRVFVSFRNWKNKRASHFVAWPVSPNPQSLG